VTEYLFVVRKSKNDLKGTNALKYIESGERLEVDVIRGSKRGRRKLPELETVKNRSPFWYSLPELEPPEILFPRMMRGRFVVFLNRAKCQAPHVFVYIYTKGSPEVITGYLNSSVSQFLCELTGRQYTGMLDMETEDIKRLPIINPSKLTKPEVRRISLCFLDLIKTLQSRIKAEKDLKSFKAKTKTGRDVGLFEADARRELEKTVKAEEEARKKLDEAVYEALRLTEEERRQVEEGLKELQELRRLRTQA